MKINLKPKTIAEIQELRNSLDRLHRKTTGTNREFSKLENRQAELAEEISKLESADPSDKKARAALRDARDEQEAVSRRLEELNRAAAASFSSNQGDQIFTALNDAQNIVNRALAPVLDSRLKEITSIFRPFFRDESWAGRTAMQCPAFMEFVNYTKLSRGIPGSVTPSHIARFIALCDEVLAGELKFEFNPNDK